MNRFLEIDALRAFACVIILVAHTCQEFSLLPGADPLAKVIHDFLWQIDLGRSAVIVFFSISGYVICSTIKGERKSGSINFWGRRLFRLYPVFWLSNIAALLFIFWPTNSISIAQFIANLTMTPKVFGYESLVAVYWTLETELMFYFLSWLIFMLGFHNKAQMLLLMCTLLVLLTLVFIVNREIAPDYHYWRAMPYHISFMFWAALYRLFNDKPTEKVYFGRINLSHKAIFIIATTIVLMPALLALWVYTQTQDVIALRNSVSYIIGVFAFITLTRWIPLRSKILAHIGNYTYAIYLFHAIVILSLIHFIKIYAPNLGTWPILFWISAIFQSLQGLGK